MAAAGTATFGSSEALTWAKFLEEVAALQFQRCLGATTGPEENYIPALKRCAVLENVSPSKGAVDEGQQPVQHQK